MKVMILMMIKNDDNDDDDLWKLEPLIRLSFLHLNFLNFGQTDLKVLTSV